MDTKVNLIKIQPSHITSNRGKSVEPAPNTSKSLPFDTFEKQSATPAFTSVNSEMALLRKYAKDLGCAYTDGKMLRAETFDYIMSKVNKFKSDKALVEFISKYSEYLDTFEKKILSFYRASLRQNPSSSIEQVTKERFETSASRLQPAYLFMVNNLEALSTGMRETKHSKRLRATIDAWKQDLLNGDLENAIASNKYQTIIEKMRFAKAEQPIRAKLFNAIGTLPNPSDDFDAFMVKYKDSSRRVIIKRLLTPYTVSIEHIKAKANGGHASAIGNCMLVRTKENNGRGHDDIMLHHPEREFTIKKYFNRVVDKINNGGMKEILFYPFELKKSLEAETHNRINLDKEIARLKISEEEAYKTFKA